MTPYNQRIRAFVELGKYLTNFCEKCYANDDSIDLEFKEIVLRAEHENGWFTQENILYSLREWGQLLNQENIESWLSHYNLNLVDTPKTIGIIMAGNIPLVGFHDFLCVILSGHRVLAKLSSNDKRLLPHLVKFLVGQDPSLQERIAFVDGKMEGFEAVIATGSNNTGRYFEYYFGQKPHIIRKNRNSVAILTGKETHEELVALGEDIFRYYGLGCRNVSKIYIPQGYDFEPFFKAMYNYGDIIHQHKYANNYDYNKAVYLMSDFKILDNEFLVLKEESSLSSPISILFYSYYGSEENLQKELERLNDQIQCVVSNQNKAGHVGFGQTQKPQFDDYADGIDTMEFLLQL
jgi:Acyl-CoA reductase (LuxC).